MAEMDSIREAFTYQSRFNGAIIVFKIDFCVTESPLFPFLMKDIALLAKTGIKPVIVPGAKQYIDKILLEHGIVSTYNNGQRVTGGGAIPFVEMAAFHAAERFITALSANRLDAVIGNFVRSRGLGVVDGHDTEHTGMVDKIYTSGLRRLLDNGMIPILPCIGWSPVGKPYNVSSDEIALSVSAALGAVKLIIISACNCLAGLRLPPEIKADSRGVVPRLRPADAEKILLLNVNEANNDNAEPLTGAPARGLGELRLALKALKAGVERAHIINGLIEGSVLREIFSNLGFGTMLYNDDYESIRPIKHHDIPDILRIMDPLMNCGILIRRGAEDIQAKKDDYVVFEIDGSIHACGALHDWGEGQGEIAAIAAERSYLDMGFGKRIVRFLIERARSQGMSRVFVLTTHAQDWFESLGFQESPVDSLPARKRKIYNWERASKVFALVL